MSAISLFIPYPVVSTLPDTRRPHRQIALKRTATARTASDTLIVDGTGFAQESAQHPHPHVILITGDAVSTSQESIIGAFLPSALPLKLRAEDTRRKERHKAEAGASYVLFELRPNFRLYR